MRKKNLTQQDLEDVSVFMVDLDQGRDFGGKPRIDLHNIKIDVKCLTQKQGDLKRAIKDKDVVISTGPAGTGRTYTSLLTALHVLKTEPKYKKLVLVKSLQTIPGESVGILPGTLWEKLEPYMYSFIGNLNKIFGGIPSIAKALIGQGIIEFLPIAYVRGVTIDDAIVIVDEAQNIDMHTFKTIITRMGRNCKMIFLGDVDQIDRKNEAESCLNRVAHLFSKFEDAAYIKFTDDESVRNPLIPKLLRLMDSAA